MKYTKEERLDIGRRMYYEEINRFQAAEIYGVTPQTARDYMRLYRDENGLPPKKAAHRTGQAVPTHKVLPKSADLEAYESMTKEELILELVKARIAEARLKKGYEVKGDGSVINYSSKNTR